MGTAVPRGCPSVTEGPRAAAETPDSSAPLGEGEYAQMDLKAQTSVLAGRVQERAQAPPCELQGEGLGLGLSGTWARLWTARDAAPDSQPCHPRVRDHEVTSPAEPPCQMGLPPCFPTLSSTFSYTSTSDGMRCPVVSYRQGRLHLVLSGTYVGGSL